MLNKIYKPLKKHYRQEKNIKRRDNNEKENCYNNDTIINYII
jgi:hypothetical protein